MLTAFTSMLLIAGVGMLLFSLRSLKTLTDKIGSDETRRYWRVVRGLVWLFLASYLLAFYMVVRPYTLQIVVLTALVFFFGGVFVLLVLELSKRSIVQLEASNAAKREAETELAPAPYSGVGKTQIGSDRSDFWWSCPRFQ